MKPRNPAMAGGKDAPDRVYEVWACGPPRGDYPGSLPLGFLNYARPWMNGRGLVPFAGALRITGALHIDLDPGTKPDIVGDVGKLPELLGARRFDWILADPPYGDDYNRALYKTASQVRTDRDRVGRSYKSDNSTYWPHRWLVAMSKVLAPGGNLLYLDQLIPPGPRDTTCVRRAFVYRGTNLRATCCSIFRKNGHAQDLRAWTDPKEPNP